uniref:RING-H2 finger protein ATL46-like n=1 Tax=Erigeron canadensis TaxID=72917 RepID=UPI001CB90E05|nr:RING-H2 finger protein ATL46-like [Erigeron canadensis]
MGRILSENHQENGTRVQLITISPALLWVIVSLAAIFFISGILHVILQFYTKNQTYDPSVSQSNRYTDHLRPQSLGRQLQQLFRLQDSGLDQSFIDSLPVFDYKHINGLKDPFDCAVCLCEFSPHDKLRLIPICSHAFHTHCIDTWLLSKSTCPLCRVNLSNVIPSQYHNGLRENLMNVTNNSITHKIHCNEKNLEKRVLSVRLGKLKSSNVVETSNFGENSRSNMDARRCFSMGAFQYVVDNNIDLQVAMLNVKDNVRCGKSEDITDERKIKYESFSVSKVWLWTKKGGFQVSSSEPEVGGLSSSQNTTMVPGI